MKKVLTIAALILAPLTLVGSSGLAWTCVDGTMDGGNCYPGHVHFTGSGYPNNVHITVTKNSNGTVYDDFDYDGGAVDFTESLYPRGDYTIAITGVAFSQTTNVSTGSAD